MAQTIKLRRSGVEGKIPDTSSLALGEIAINTFDGRVFIHKSGSGFTQSIEHLITTNSETTGSINLIGNITASGIISASGTSENHILGGNLSVGPNTDAAVVGIGNSSNGGRIRFGDHNSDNNSINYGSGEFQIRTTQGTGITFYTNGANKRARINNDGNFSIGGGGFNPSSRLHVSGNIRLQARYSVDSEDFSNIQGSPGRTFIKDVIADASYEDTPFLNPETINAFAGADKWAAITASNVYNSYVGNNPPDTYTAGVLQPTDLRGSSSHREFYKEMFRAGGITFQPYFSESIAGNDLDEIVIEINHTDAPLRYHSMVGLQFTHPNWRARRVKIEAYTGSDNPGWVTALDVNNQDQATVAAYVNAGSDGIERTKFTLGRPKNSGSYNYIRINKIFGYDYKAISSGHNDEIKTGTYYLDKFNDTAHYGIVFPASGNVDLGKTSDKYRNVYSQDVTIDDWGSVSASLASIQTEGGVNGSGATDKLAIWSDSDTLTSDTNLHWDTSNDRLGIGVSNPSSLLHLKGGSSLAKLLIESEDDGSPATTAHIELKGYDGRGKGIFLKESGSFSGKEIFFGAPYSGQNEVFSIGYNGYSSGSAEYLASSSFYLNLESNKLGLGTTKPERMLHISGSGGNTQIILEKVDNDAIIESRTRSAGAYFRADSMNSSGYAGLELFSDSVGKWFIGSYGTTDFQIVDGPKSTGTAHLTVKDATGKVGIGTTTPSEKLTVEGNISSSGTIIANGLNTVGNISFTGTSNNEINSVVNLILNADSDSNSGDTYRNIIFQNRGSETARITAAGNVGIGTESPQELLTLEGGNLLVTSSGGTRKIEVNVNSSSSKAQLELRTLRNNAGMGSSTLYKTGSLTFFDTDEDFTVRPNGRAALNIRGAGDIQFISSSDYDETVYFTGDSSTKRIGIGTQTPDSRLEIRAEDQEDVALKVGHGNFSNFIVGTNTGHTRLEIATGSYHHTFFTRTDGAASSKRFTIEGGSATGKSYFQNTNVGIGTATPTSLLHIIASDGTMVDTYVSQITNQEATNGDNFGVKIQAGTNSNDVNLQLNNSSGDSLFRVRGDGRVGIGTTSPGHLLHVQSGSIQSQVITDISYSSSSDWSQPISSDALYLHNSSLGSYSGSVGLFFRANSNSGASAGRITLHNQRNGRGSFVFMLRDNDHTAQIKEKARLDSKGIFTSTDVTIDDWGSVSASLASIQTEGGINGSGASNKLAIWSDADTLTNDTNLHWDTSNDRLGIGTSVPSDTLTVAGTISGSRIVGKTDSGFSAEFQGPGANGVMHIRPSTAGTGNPKPVILYRDNPNGNALYLLADGVNTRFGLYDSGLSGAPTSSRNMITITPATATRKNPKLHIGSSLSTAAELKVGGNILLVDSSSDDSYINTQGNFGIGTSSPGHTLHVLANNNLNTVAVFESSDDTAFIRIKDNDTDAHLISKDGDFHIGETSSDFKKFTVQLDTGNIGMGTDNPLGTLHIYNTSSTNATGSTDISSSRSPMTSTDQDSIVLYGHGTNGEIGETYGSITWMGGNRRRAMISAVAEANDSDHIGLVFYTQGTDGAGDFFESMRISRDGEVGIGTPSPSDQLEVSGSIRQTGPNYNLRLTAGSNVIGSNHVLVQANTSYAQLKSINDTVFIDAGTDIRFRNSSNNSIHGIFKNTGKFGIGTIDPGSKLHISGGAAWFAGNPSTPGDESVVAQLGQKDGDVTSPLVKIYTDDVGEDTLEFHTTRFLSATKFNHTSASAGTNRIDSVTIKGSQTAGGSIEIYGKGGLGGVKTTIGTSINTTGNITASGDISASGTITADNIVTNGLTNNGDLTVTGTLTANEIVTNVVSQSIVFASGSNIFGDDVADTHEFTGSVSISSSLDTFGDITLTSGSVRINTFQEGIQFYNGSSYTSNRIKLTSANNLQINTAGSLQISPTNAVGILNGKPLQFNTEGNNYNGFKIFATTGSIEDAGRLDFEDKDGNHIMTLSGSSVGIGQTAPSVPLEVIGTIKQKQGSGYSNYVEQTISEAQLTINANATSAGYKPAIIFAATGTEIARIDGAGNITASGDMSASGALFASMSSDSNTSFKTVVYDEGTGKLFTTGSYGGGGGGLSAVLAAELSASLVSAVGGVENGNGFDAGASLESVLRAILVQFVPPVFSSFSITGLDNTLEVGSTEQNTINGGTFVTASSTSNGTGFENNGGSFSLALTGNATDDGDISATYSGNGSISFTSPASITVKRTSAGNVQFNLTGTDQEGNVTVKSDQAGFRFPIFYGGSSNDGSGGDDAALADILGDISSSISSTSNTSGIVILNTLTATYGQQTLINTTSGTNLPSNTKISLPSSVAGGANYTYIVIPSAYGNLTSMLKNSVQDEFGTFNSGVPLFTANHERFSGVNTEYNVFRSSGQNAFAQGDTLTFND